MNTQTHTVIRGTRILRLTPTEFSLFEFFLCHPGQILNRNLILDDVWGFNYGGNSNVVDVYVSYLRKKLEAHNEPRIIQTVPKIGYVLREENM